MDLEHLGRRLTTGLVRVAVAVQRGTDPDADQGSERTVAQHQALLLLARRQREYSLSDLAAALGMPVPATQAAVAQLCRQGLVEMGPAPSYSPHEMRVRLTPAGRSAVPDPLNWADAMLAELARTDGFAELDETDLSRLLRMVTDQIMAMQRRGEIPITRMCVTCRFFDSYAHPGTDEPHHCRLVDAPFGHRQLRLHCPDQEPR